LYETFSGDDAPLFAVGEDHSGRYTLEHGAYGMQATSPHTLVWSQLEGVYDTIAIETETKVTRASSPVAVGMLFRYQDEHNFYLFAVSSNGFYRLECVEHGRWYPLIDWTPDAAIATTSTLHPTATNVLRVEVVDEYIALSVNGHHLETTMDTTFAQEQGGIALAVNTFADDQAMAYFDNFALYKPEGSK
jgi:hypothetical protein